MAGSYSHATTKKGKLRNPESMQQMLDTFGDCYEAIEEMYGMIQLLAEEIANEQSGAQADRALIIESVRQRYSEGIELGGRQK